MHLQILSSAFSNLLLNPLSEFCITFFVFLSFNTSLCVLSKHFTEVTVHFYYEYFESFSGISDTPISLRLISGDIFCSFYWAMFPSVFFFLDTLCWCLNIGKNDHLPRLYRLDSCRGRPSPVSLARDSGDLSHFSCGCVFSELVYVNS